jgi:hypothetical protein
MQDALAKKPVAAAVPVVTPEGERGFLFLGVRYSFVAMPDGAVKAATAWNTQVYTDWHAHLMINKVRAVLLCRGSQRMHAYASPAANPSG